MSFVTTYRITGWLFPRAVALVYLIAFGSWYFQFGPLTGEQGLMPVGTFLENVGIYVEREGRSAFTVAPSLYWWLGYSDAIAGGLCLAGCALALLVMAGVLQGPLLLLLWAGYLSIVTTGDVFMSYQWDALLLEAGFIAMLIAPWRTWARLRNAPSRWQMLLPQFLLLKLMFLSGVVKLTSKDPTWANDTALLYHYETQPLPTWIGWWAHQLPEAIQVWSCKIMFGIELVLPVLALVAVILELVWSASHRITRWIKWSAAVGFILLMIGVALTGNYTFFNLLTIILSLSLIDDAMWPKRRKHLDQKQDVEVPFIPVWRSWVQIITVVVMLAISLHITLERQVFQPEKSGAISKFLSPFASINTYGLFAVMTTERNEIVMEVSDDGIYWQPLEFKWKPGALDHQPGFVAPHQPRLDWQMWFAALYPGFDPGRDANSSRMAWFGQMMVAILEQRPAFMEMLEPPPIPAESIRHVRARFYRYEFTTPEQLKESGDWWTRVLLGNYSPTFSKRR